MNSATDTQKERKAVDYSQLAAAYMTDKLTSAVFFQDVLYRYDGTRYVAERQLCHKVRQWLIQHSHPHNNHVVSNVVGCIQAMRLADNARYPGMPFYNGKKEEFPANVIAYKNGLLDVDAWLLKEMRNCCRIRQSGSARYAFPTALIRQPNARCGNGP